MALNETILKEAHQLALRRWESVSGLAENIDIPDLTRQFVHTSYRISRDEGTSKLEGLLMPHQVVVVTGGFYGDEAKGKWGNVLSDRCDLVIRANSGANTGRTAYLDGERYVFHVIPSAVLHGKSSLVGSEVVSDPISLVADEIDPLLAKGISLHKLMFGNFHVATPGHRIMDVIGSARNGSTGVGIKGVHAGMKMKRNLRLNDLVLGKEHISQKLLRSISHYEGFVAAHGGAEEIYTKLTQGLESGEISTRVVPQHVRLFAHAHMQGGIEGAAHFLAQEYVKLLSPDGLYPGGLLLRNNRVRMRDIIQVYLQSQKRILLEGTQGFYLANNNEVGHRQGTSADCNAQGILSAAGINTMRYRPIVFSIHKAPGTSRVGGGDVPFSHCGSNVLSEAGASSLKDLGDRVCADFAGIREAYFNHVDLEDGLVEPFLYEDSTGEYDSGIAMAISSSRELGEKGATTGKPRITGWLDLVAMKEVVDAHGPLTFLSCIDRGSSYEKIGLVVGYIVSLPNGRDSLGEHFSVADNDTHILTDIAGELYLDCNGTQYRNGDVIQIGDSLPNSHVLNHCLPIVRVMDGWKGQEITETNTSLPAAAVEYLATIEGLTGAEIVGIGVGPEDHQALYLTRE